MVSCTVSMRMWVWILAFLTKLGTNQWGWDRQVPGAHGTVSLAKPVTSRDNESECSSRKTKQNKINLLWTRKKSADNLWHLNTHIQVHTCAHAHMIFFSFSMLWVNLIGHFCINRKSALFGFCFFLLLFKC